MYNGFKNEATTHQALKECAEPCWCCSRVCFCEFASEWHNTQSICFCEINFLSDGWALGSFAVFPSSIFISRKARFERGGNPYGNPPTNVIQLSNVWFPKSKATVRLVFFKANFPIYLARGEKTIPNRTWKNKACRENSFFHFAHGTASTKNVGISYHFCPSFHRIRPGCLLVTFVSVARSSTARSM